MPTNKTMRVSLLSPITYKRNTSIKDVAASKRSRSPISSDLKAGSVTWRSTGSRMQSIDITRNLSSGQGSREGGFIA